jgi:hypothetical protein
MGPRWCRQAVLYAIAAMFAAQTWLSPARAAEDIPVDLELILAIDISGSIDPEEARLQRDGYIAALTDKRVLAAIGQGFHRRIAVTYMEWAGIGHHWTLVEWSVIGSEHEAGVFAKKLNDAPLVTAVRTSISGALAYALPQFEGNGFTAPRQVIDISGDGPNNHGPLVTIARDAVLARGVTINGLPIVNDRPNRFGFPQLPDLDLYYENCVIGGPGAFIVVAEGFQAFPAAILRKLILEIAGTGPPRAQPAQGWQPPPCDIGEKQLQQYFRTNPFETF